MESYLTQITQRRSYGQDQTQWTIFTALVLEKLQMTVERTKCWEGYGWTSLRMLIFSYWGGAILRRQISVWDSPSRYQSFLTRRQQTESAVPLRCGVSVCAFSMKYDCPRVAQCVVGFRDSGYKRQVLFSLHLLRRIRGLLSDLNTPSPAQLGSNKNAWRAKILDRSLISDVFILRFRKRQRLVALTNLPKKRL